MESAERVVRFFGGKPAEETDPRMVDPEFREVAEDARRRRDQQARRLAPQASLIRGGNSPDFM